MPALEAYPDSVFMQDPALLGSRVSVVGRFGEAARLGEATALTEDLARTSAKVGELRTVSEPGTLEGGDVVVTDRGLFVGESMRTNSRGIEQLAIFLNGQRVSSVKTPLMHLLCGCSYLSKGTMIIAPDLVRPELFPKFDFVKIPQDEAYAADALYLGQGKVLIPSGFPRTVARLKDAGYEPVEIDVSEFHKGDGGVTCLSSPVYTVF
jgi:dimethylargininase